MIKKYTKLILPIIAIALIFRLPLLNGSFWLDEAAQALESSRSLSKQLQIDTDFQPPLLHLILYLSLKISQHEWWLRTIAALIPGLTTIYFTYLIGKKIQNQNLGLLAASLLAINNFHIFYSQELRPYSLPAMFAAISFYIYLNLNQNIRTWIKLTIINILGIYSSYLYPFFLLSQLVILLLVKKKLIKKIAISYFIVAVSFLPWLTSFIRQLQTGTALQAQLPGWSQTVSISQLKGLLMVFGKFIYGVTDLQINYLFILISIILAICFGLLFINTLKTRNKIPENLLSLSLWYLIPLVSSWFVSFIIPIIRPKRLLFILPALTLIISLVSLDYKSDKTKFKKIKFIGLGLYILINMITNINYYQQPQLQRENWKLLYESIATNYQPDNTILVFAYAHPFSPWVWYDTQKFPYITNDEYLIHNESLIVDQLKIINDYDYVILFDYMRTLTDPNNILPSNIHKYGFANFEIINLPNIGFVRVYTKQYNTLANQ